MRTRKINSGIYCTVLLTFHMIAGLQIRKNVIFKTASALHYGMYSKKANVRAVLIRIFASQ